MSARGEGFVFRKSTRRFKKYMVYVPQKGTWVHFGDVRYQQYKDSTPAHLYRRLDHHDPSRRRSFKSRHARTRSVNYSPSWFADKYLW